MSVDPLCSTSRKREERVDFLNRERKKSEERGENEERTWNKGEKEEMFRTLLFSRSLPRPLLRKQDGLLDGGVKFNVLYLNIHKNAYMSIGYFSPTG